MSFNKLQYDVVLIETPAKYVVERYDQPNFPAIGVAYVGNYLEKNVGITPAIIDAKLGRKAINETIKYVVDFKILLRNPNKIIKKVCNYLNLKKTIKLMK